MKLALFFVSLFIQCCTVFTPTTNDGCRYLQSGYTLFDRVIRPAEVGVTQGGESEEDKKESDA